MSAKFRNKLLLSQSFMLVEYPQRGIRHSAFDLTAVMLLRTQNIEAAPKLISGALIHDPFPVVET